MALQLSCPEGLCQSGKARPRPWGRGDTCKDRSQDQRCLTEGFFSVLSWRRGVRNKGVQPALLSWRKSGLGSLGGETGITLGRGHLSP